MYKEQSKKMIVLYIFEIFKKYTDENHTLSQKEISDILKRDYNISAERKAIHRYIFELRDLLETDFQELGYEIHYSETSRMVPVRDEKTGENVLQENVIKSDFYLLRPVTEGELRLVLDSLLFSPHISNSQSKALAKKLEGLSNIYFKSHTSHIACLPNEHTDNQELFLNIEKLDEAIGKNQKVAFKYTKYGTDKKRSAKKDAEGKDKIYIVSPYQMATKEGKYYLICNNDKYDTVSNFRIDRIKNVEILDEITKPYESLQWSNGKRLDLATYMKEHIYMYSSESVHVKFKVVHAMVSDVIDIFGKDVRFLEEDEKYVTVSSKTNELAMLQFAKRYLPDVVVLEPQRLRDKVKEELERSMQEYR